MTQTLDEKIKEHLKIKPHDTPPYCSAYRKRRQDFLDILKIAGVKYGAEIGVNRAGHALGMLNTIPGLHLLCIDPWKAYHKRNLKSRQERCYRTAKKNLKPFENARIIRDTSLNAVKGVADGYLDFVYIDGSHIFDDCMNDLIAWGPKVRIGGIISGHDYTHSHMFGVIEAVNAYTRAHNVIDWYIIKDRQGTYFWVKKHND
jgi:hypothetical protein